MLSKIKQAGYIIYKAGDNLVDNDGVELAGYLTFLTLLALFPFLVLIVAAAGFAGQGEVGTRFIELLITHMPDEAVVAIRPRVDEIMSGPPQGLLTISILGAIWTSSSAVEGMRTVLNRAYQVSNPPTYVLRRLMSILQLVIFTFVLLLVMLCIVISPLILTQLQSWINTPISPDLAQVWNQILFYLGAVLLFLVVASLYYFLPNIKQKLLCVAPGAALVVVLWLAGAAGFSFYIANVDQVNVIYGSLGGFIATLLFFFIMNLIFIYGAEFNHMLNIITGERIIEKEHVEDSSHEVSLTDNPRKH